MHLTARPQQRIVELRIAVIIGLGPAGAIAALRARARGMGVLALDHRLEENPTELPEWPATYGLVDAEVPGWAEEFVRPAHEIRVVTTARRTPDFGYRMLDSSALRQAVVDAGVTLIRGTERHVPEVLGQVRRDNPGAEVLLIDCRGARPDGRELWQVAYGMVLRGRSAQVQPTFMDWRPVEARVAPASFLYIQPVDGGMLWEETVLATDQRPEDLRELLADRLRQRLRSAGVAGDVETVDTEFVAIPMGLREGSWARRRRILVDANPPRAVEYVPFGSRGGLVHPASGYSVGAAMQAVDEVLAGTTRRRALGVDMAFYLRLVGARLIARASPETLQDFFDAFFRMSRECQLAYLTGHHPLAVAATMWQLRAYTGFWHPFLRPLVTHPRAVLGLRRRSRGSATARDPLR
ncbi:Lycopene beta cyclase [Corynebacterium heidelbergense]|nr:Lycopene beta cyclase [Corynebacterium heidelbergense]